MGNINVSRWILGGVVAAIVLFVVDYMLNGIILAQQWNDAMAAIQKPAMTVSAGLIVLFAVLNLITGLTAIWIYAGIRPRFGPGVSTAIYAGLATWLLCYLVPNVSLLAFDVLPAGLIWTIVIVGVIQAPAATVAGAYLYQES